MSMGQQGIPGAPPSDPRPVRNGPKVTPWGRGGGRLPPSESTPKAGKLPKTLQKVTTHESREKCHFCVTFVFFTKLFFPY